ncbi:MAG: DUF503 domain-containing protein [Candidatus Competibacterales bacterium]
MTASQPRMIIDLLVVELRLPGCESLKEKRQRISGLRERFGKQANVSVCETAYQDNHKLAQWSFVAVSLDRNINQRALAKIEQYLGCEIDAVVTAIHREQL